MTIITVTTQAELDAALIFGGDTPDEALAKARDCFARDPAAVKDVAALAKARGE